MGNIFDYLDWRGDIPFSADPFNEVDNLILSWLAYTDFENVVPGPESGKSLSVREVNRRYFSLHPEKEILARPDIIGKSGLLLPKLAVSRRFSSLRLSNYINLVDADIDMQLAAVLYEVGDGTVYAAFRGTDNTFIGWKEDFDFSYSLQTPGQCQAALYLDRTLRRGRKPIRVGGHSKGGNFAIFASANCAESIRNRIIQIYSNDGPGFIEKLTDSPAFLEVNSRVIKIIPETSMIGILMTTGVPMKIVRSSQKGVLQHDGTSWQVLGNHFVTADDRSSESYFFDKTMRNWISSVDTEGRKRFIDSLFSLFDTAGIDSVLDFKASRLKSTAELLKAVEGLSPSDRKQFFSVLFALARSYGRSLQDSLLDTIQDGIQDGFAETIKKRIPAPAANAIRNITEQHSES